MSAGTSFDLSRIKLEDRLTRTERARLVREILTNFEKAGGVFDQMPGDARAHPPAAWKQLRQMLLEYTMRGEPIQTDFVWDDQYLVVMDLRNYKRHKDVVFLKARKK